MKTKNKLGLIAAVAAALLGTLGVTDSPAPMEMFLKIDTIDGEATDSKHQDWIIIESMSHGVLRPTTNVVAGGGSGRTTGPCVLQDIVVTKEVDKSTPKLNLALCDGTSFQDVEIELVRSVAGTNQTYYKIEFHDVLVSSVQPSGSADSSGDKPTEEVSFNFTKIVWTYTEFDDTKGTSKGQTTATWDLTAPGPT